VVLVRSRVCWRVRFYIVCEETRGKEATQEVAKEARGKKTAQVIWGM